MSTAKKILQTAESYDELISISYEECIKKLIYAKNFSFRAFYFRWGSMMYVYSDGRVEAIDEDGNPEFNKRFDINNEYNLKVLERTKEALLKALDEIYREEGRT